MVVLRKDERGDLWIWPGSGFEAPLVVDVIKRRPMSRRRWVLQWRAWWVCQTSAKGTMNALSQVGRGLLVDDGQHDDLFEKLRVAWFARLSESERLVVAELLREPRPWGLIAAKLEIEPSEVGNIIEYAWAQLLKVRLLQKEN